MAQAVIFCIALMLLSQTALSQQTLPLQKDGAAATPSTAAIPVIDCAAMTPPISTAGSAGSAGSAAAIIDTREAAQCESASLKTARCLPASDFLAAHNRLANISGLLWLLGTAGLTGREHVLVIGDQTRDKEFIAGLLYLAGQRKITVLATPVAKLAAARLAPGTLRSTTREKIFSAAMRSDRIVLRRDIVTLIREGRAPVILDGRSEAEYWGETIRASRGGHLPGAQLLAMTSLAIMAPHRMTPHRKKTSPGGTPPRAPIHIAAGKTAIAYGHDSYEGLIYLARLIARHVPAKLYSEGWAGWASDGALPADSVTYPDRAALKRPAIARAVKPLAAFGGLGSLVLLAVAAVAGICMFAAGFFASRIIGKSYGD